MYYVKLIICVSQIIHLLSFFSNLRAATCLKAVSPTHFIFARYPHPKEADPKGQLLAFIRIVSECDDRYCRGHHSHYSLQIIPTFSACCSMTTCRCRASSRYPYQLVDTHTQPLSSSRYSHVKKYSYSFDNQKNSYCFCMKDFVYLKCKKQKNKYHSYDDKDTI